MVNALGNPNDTAGGPEQDKISHHRHGMMAAGTEQSGVRMRPQELRGAIPQLTLLEGGSYTFAGTIGFPVRG